MRWLVVEGARHEVFRSLGQWVRTDVQAMLAESAVDLDVLRRWADTVEGKACFGPVLAATERDYGTQLAELAALAEGAGVPVEDLLLTSLRGDFGTAARMGCSDLAWRRETTVVAHNEDADPLLDGRLMLLTLLVEGEAAVTALWYPGTLPVNAFVVTGQGLAWGINHIPAVHPYPGGAGRHFVARALQQAAGLDEAVAHLQTHPSAGGFTYTIAERASGRATVVEAVAGQIAIVEATPDNPLHWHTNHLRHIPEPPDLPPAGPEATELRDRYAESVARGRALSGLTPGPTEPSRTWFLQALTSAPLPHGVYRVAAGPDPLMTLCTAIADMNSDTITIRSSTGQTVTCSLTSFTHGVPAIS
ncbi:C45 family autoproteolytic acyltransferase/hydolase [Streptomyces sp. RPT161]|uniref:C45 family autoproteolytic acyltransferase/hydolase n=1 Tax=Streptomyces sp. RPT161 TaxID=3015993 RepID=UPI0022B87E84|nr:C45 family peptidase [Streptomyces sp. RPT161]